MKNNVDRSLQENGYVAWIQQQNLVKPSSYVFKTLPATTQDILDPGLIHQGIFVQECFALCPLLNEGIIVANYQYTKF